MEQEFDLIRQVRQGNEDAWWKLVDLHTEDIWNRCHRLVGDDYDAEDLMQDLLVRLWEKRHTFRGDSRFTTWIYPIATRMTIDRYKKKRTQQNRVVSLDALVAEDAVGGEANDIIDGGTHCDPTYYTVVENMRKQMIRELLVCQEEPTRSILYLHVYKGMSFQGIAIKLNMSLKAVQGRWGRFSKLKSNQEVIVKLKQLEE